MAPARNLLRRHYDSYGGCFGDAQLELHQEKPSLVSRLMADEGPRSDEKFEGEEEVGTSTSKEGDERDEGWLQLGVGGQPSGDAPMRETRELNLFTDRPPDPRPILRPPLPMSAVVSNIPVMVPWPPPVAGRLGYRWEAPWGARSLNLMASTSTLPPPMMADFSSRQFGYPSVRSGEEMRVVDPPPRPQIGVWFVLRAAQNQVKEPFLPQIPKNYLRIKDGRMTVRLLMKYLANKLGLDDESEVEISCRGQQLPPSLTLQHVRDNLWCSREAVASLPDTPSTEHVMILQYSRRA